MARTENQTKRLVAAKTRGRCYYCGQRGKLGIDHVQPVARGGLDIIGNLVPACRSCNSAKCARTLREFRHSCTVRVLGYPPNTTKQHINWARRLGADLSAYDSFRFWFQQNRTEVTHNVNRLHEREAEQAGV